MNIEDIKKKMEERSVSIAELADALKVSYDSLRQVLSGQRKLTDQLAKHIELELDARHDQWVMYKITFPDEEVGMLIPTADSKEPKDKEHLLELIVKENLRQLIEAGRKIQWTEEQRRLLGLPTDPSLLSKYKSEETRQRPTTTKSSSKPQGTTYRPLEVIGTGGKVYGGDTTVEREDGTPRISGIRLPDGTLLTGDGASDDNDTDEPDIPAARLGPGMD